MADAHLPLPSEETMAPIPDDSSMDHPPSPTPRQLNEDRLLLSDRLSPVSQEHSPLDSTMPSAASGQEDGSTVVRPVSDHAESHLRNRRSRPLKGSTPLIGINPPVSDSRRHDLKSPIYEQGTSGAGDGKRGFATHASQPHTLPYHQRSQYDSPVVSADNSPVNTRTPVDQPAHVNVKIPFSHPIVAPPRQFPHQILMVNPTSTTTLTNILVSTLRPVLPAALEVTAFTGSWPCPTAIESTTDALLSTEYCLRELAKYSTNNSETIQNFDALLVCNYGKHPLVDTLRESYDVPVIGIMEASLYVARMLGARFGILVLNQKAAIGLQEAVSASGLGQFFIGVEVLQIPYLDLVNGVTSHVKSTPPSIASAASQTQPEASSEDPPVNPQTIERLSATSRALVARGADTIILGSECLSAIPYLRAVKDAVRDEDGRRTVNVIDAVEAGVMMLNGLVGMGAPTSKKGFYKNEREARLARGQMWM